MISSACVSSRKSAHPFLTVSGSPTMVERESRDCSTAAFSICVQTSSILSIGGFNCVGSPLRRLKNCCCCDVASQCALSFRSEEHTSELQSRFDIVCRL